MTHDGDTGFRIGGFGRRHWSPFLLRTLAGAALITLVGGTAGFLLTRYGRAVAGLVEWDCWGGECGTDDPRSILVVGGIAMLIVATLAGAVVIAIFRVPAPLLLALGLGTLAITIAFRLGEAAETVPDEFFPWDPTNVVLLIAASCLLAAWVVAVVTRLDDRIRQRRSRST